MTAFIPLDMCEMLHCSRWMEPWEFCVAAIKGVSINWRQIWSKCLDVTKGEIQIVYPKLGQTQVSSPSDVKGCPCRNSCNEQYTSDKNKTNSVEISRLFFFQKVKRALILLYFMLNQTSMVSMARKPHEVSFWGQEIHIIFLDINKFPKRLQNITPPGSIRWQ